MNRFQTFHTYQTLVRDGKAHPLKCPECHVGYVAMYDNNLPDDIVLYCAGCNSTIIIGLSTWQQIEAIVKEHVIY